jgi:hypothetical protein
MAATMTFMLDWTTSQLQILLSRVVLDDRWVEVPIRFSTLTEIINRVFFAVLLTHAVERYQNLGLKRWYQHLGLKQTSKVATPSNL